MDEQQPATPEEVKDEAIKEKNQKIQDHKGALEKLPPDIRRELDDMIRLKNPSAARKYMIEKYGQQFPVLAQLMKNTYYKYAKKHNLKSGISTELKAEIVGTSPELLNVINKIADPATNIGDKRAALTALYNDCAETSRRLEATQVNFVDPQLQAVILANRKQMCTIVEKLSVLNDQLSKDSDKDWLSEAEHLLDVFTSAVVNSYKITHTDQSNFFKFIGDFRERLKEAMKTYNASKESEPSKSV